ncbi:polysaccharide lyase family 7 protein [uncultured Winogradskyella sp.]|uniref:polysaccharide lyase family 7 protein n=1 Tax=uncultured Winogradskyella sp. TaxID=395353 RepID=UPI0030EB3213|tara:strand:- start:2164 stop:3066 length:903 start_codon:yes stop_codon:yes gene_type:complete
MKRILISLICVGISLGCSNRDNEDDIVFENIENPNDDNLEVYANIDFSNWKVTLPVDENNNGSPDEYQPSELINGAYRANTSIQPYMYDDVADSSIEFYTFPDVSTTNSSYSRTELRELINPAIARENWSLEEGGTMTGRLKIVDISEDNVSSNRQYHNTIVMQIHGIISLEDMATHGFSSNNGPPLIKIRWIDGYIYAYKKSLVDETTIGDDLLETSSATWVDASTNMGYVGFDEFEFRITASTGRLELQLNNETPLVYEDVSMNKWPFENYFKAGNYLGSTAEGAYSKVKYYELEVVH